MSQSAMPWNRALRAGLLSAGLLLPCFPLTGTGAAEAQGFGRTFFEDDVLPPRVIAWRLADRGFTGVSRPRFDGRFYVVDAISPAGLPVRLVLDPANGVIVGRERVQGQDVYARLERPPPRPVPGYGWTEDDVARPLTSEPGPAARALRRPGSEAARPTEPNPLGLNPDGNHRADPPRRIARTSPTRTPDKPALRVSPPAPSPKAAVEKAAPETAKPENTPATPAANANEAPDKAPAPVTEPKPIASTAPPKQDWKDPPSEGKRPVRVIGGATVVPGTPGKEGESAPAQP